MADEGRNEERSEKKKKLVRWGRLGGKVRDSEGNNSEDGLIALIGGIRWCRV